MVGGEGKQLLFYSGLKVQANTPVDISVPIDPYYWTTVSGGEVDRETLMVVLNSLEGLYIRARYGHSSNFVCSNFLCFI